VGTSVGTEKVFDKILHPFMKNPKQARDRTELLQIDKEYLPSIL
jgi:hypothetical protein